MTIIETTVTALFIHGERSSQPEDTAPTPMLAMQRVEAIESWGLRQDRRYFHAPVEGEQRKRQISLIDEGTIRRHEQIFGPIPWNTVKAQIVLAGEVQLPDLMGATLVFDDGAELTLTIPRKPCYAMDFIAQGLREAMQGGHQGAMANVTKTGMIEVGSRVVIKQPAGTARAAT